MEKNFYCSPQLVFVQVTVADIIRTSGGTDPFDDGNWSILV